jgi:replicative DNA helicase
MSDFSPWINGLEDMEKAKIQMQTVAEGLLETGISFLDDFLFGVLPGEVSLIAAPTGQGKTELVNYIADQAAKKNKRVALFALEALEQEIAKRRLFRLLSQAYWKQTEIRKEKPRYTSWNRGQQDWLNDFEVDCDYVSNIDIFYKRENFGPDELNRFFIGVANRCDMVIIDHFHVLSFDDRNVNQEMKDAAAMITTLSKMYKKPVFLVAHVRKADRRAKSLCPSIDDIHGTSDLVKQVDLAITMARAKTEDLPFSSLKPYETAVYMRIEKFRHGGHPDESAVLIFDRAKNEYRKDYLLGVFKKGDTEFEPIDLNIPEWATNAINQKIYLKKEEIKPPVPKAKLKNYAVKDD